MTVVVGISLIFSVKRN